MSSLEKCDHDSPCEKCSGCVLCGCLCLLAGGDGEGLEEPQTVDGDPLLPFQEGEEKRCPKCLSMGVRTRYHACITTGGVLITPCEELLYLNPLISMGEHLCRRCNGCGYGWAEKTADTG